MHILRRCSQLLLLLFLTEIVNNSCSFQTFQKQFNKSGYSGQQLTIKKQTFLENCRYISQRNINSQSSYTLALDQFADLTFEELAKARGIAKLPQRGQPLIRVSDSFGSLQTNLTQIPDQLDYRALGFLSNDVKTASFCNSSWAIAAAYLYESKIFSLFLNQYASEDAIIQCASLYAPHNRISNCLGGYFQDALLFLSSVGTVAKSMFPNASYNFAQPLPNASICTEKNRIFIGDGTPVIVQNPTNDQIKRLLVQKGPLLVTLYANKDFLLYSTGLFDSCPANASLLANLVVVLYGYSGNDFWLIQGPFGDKWGYFGNMRLSMPNSCGLNSRVGYIDYNSTNSNISQYFDPALKYNKDYTNKKTNSARMMQYCWLLGLLAIGLVLVM